MRKSLLTLGLFTMLAMPAFAATASQRTGYSTPPLEFSATYGSMWGGHISTAPGNLRTGTGPSWGLNLEYPVARNSWLALRYTRQSGSLDWDPRLGAKRTLTDMNVNVWQIGSVQTFGPSRARVVPFATGSLGLTYMTPSASGVTIDGNNYTLGSMTKFSIAAGIGFKAYLGQAQRVGLRFSLQTISTIYDSAGGVYFGTGGAELGISGSGIWQYEVAGGMLVKFGG